MKLLLRHLKHTAIASIKFLRMMFRDRHRHLLRFGLRWHYASPMVDLVIVIGVVLFMMRDVIGFTGRKLH